MIKSVAIALAAVMLSGCAEKVILFRDVDNELGVACYRFQTESGRLLDGIACLKK